MIGDIKTYIPFLVHSFSLPTLIDRPKLNLTLNPFPFHAEKLASQWVTTAIRHPIGARQVDTKSKTPLPLAPFPAFLSSL